MAAIISILEINFIFFTVFIVGNLLSTVLYRSSEDKFSLSTKLCLNFVSGILLTAAIGLLSLAFTKQGLIVRGAFALLITGWIIVNSFKKNRLLYFTDFYLKFGLLPLLCFLPFAIFLLSHFNSAEISKGIDPWQLVARTASYNVPDHYLQWIVADNLYNSKELETNFNLDSKQIWSAGDRPVLIALLESTFRNLSGQSNFTAYFLRIIFIGSFIFIPLLALLKNEFRVYSAADRVLVTIFIAVSPFFLINFIFTWPKMAGLAFGLSGFFLLSEYFKGRHKILAIAAGLSFAFGIISHAAALFCLLAAFLYFAAKSFLFKTINIRDIKGLLSFLLPLIIITQLHSSLLSSVTNQTNLLPRVQFCRGGSYAFPTPVESLTESCKKYIQRVGWNGAYSDRKESLSRAFNFQPVYEAQKIIALFSDKTDQRQKRLREKFSEYLLIVPGTLGHFSLSIQIILLLIYLLAFLLRKSKNIILNSFACRSGFSDSSLLSLTAFALLTLFGSGLAEYTEMSSHVVPYIIPLFLQLGILIELSRLSRIVFLPYSLLTICFNLSVIHAVYQ